MLKPQSVKAIELSDWTFSPQPDVEAAIRHIFAKYPPSYPAGLERQMPFLKKLGNPHQKLPFIFHVAGTNGKGSTLAFLQAIFEAGGLNVHKYTSPHLVRFEERLVIGGKAIASDLLLGLIGECEEAAEGEKISFFEFFTALAFLAFSRAPATAVLLETGLGGLYDATNVVGGEHLVSLLTRISYDHMHILGTTLPEIAANKAGIIKPHVPCVIAPQESIVNDVFLKQAAAVQSPAYVYEKNWKITAHPEGFEYKSDHHKFYLPLPCLLGQHQLNNAGLALAALENSPFSSLLEQKILERAMQRVDWPGRLQKIRTKLLPAGWELWLDGAHNDSGAEILADQAKLWGNELPLHLVTAMKKTKDVSGFYRPILPYATTVQAIEANWADTPMQTAQELCGQIRTMGYEQVKTAATLESALKALTFQFPGPQRILVTGSLYLVGHALKRQF
jgi:dihydrofolate synthase/folylpolyglutamate synthase